MTEFFLKPLGIKKLLSQLWQWLNVCAGSCRIRSHRSCGLGRCQLRELRSIPSSLKACAFLLQFSKACVFSFCSLQRSTGFDLSGEKKEDHLLCIIEMVISLILPGLCSSLSLLHQLSTHYMQMTHPNSGTYNKKCINYTDSKTKTRWWDMEIFPKDSLPVPGGRARWGEWRGDEERGEKSSIRGRKRGEIKTVINLRSAHVNRTANK